MYSLLARPQPWFLSFNTPVSFCHMSYPSKMSMEQQVSSTRWFVYN
jgi:hypothetical protein